MTDVLGRLTASLADRYRVERELGQGGMATVYLAHDVRHERKVALKVLRPELAAILGAARFLQEIRTTANLQHPHILPLHDSGEVDGTVFYVMPFVDGESLRDRLSRDKQLPVDDAVRIAREVADALDYAHRHGVVHRDIKPENILLHGGHALVADFGIALAVSTVGGGTRMTETGMSLGTPHYMAPEQAMGDREITPRADVYALGVVLYEMLTGDPPFTGSTAQAIVARVVTENPRSLTSQRHTIQPNVEAAVLRALEKLPADRFESAAQFSTALGDPAFAGSGPAAAAGAGRVGRARSSLFVPLVVAGVSAIALAGGFLVGQRSAPAAPRRLLQFTVDVPESVLVIGRCCGRILALSPDGSTLVFLGTRGSAGPLYRRELGRLEAEVIPGTDGATLPFFSPDGRWLGFVADGRLRKVSLAGGPAIPIVAADQVAGASWGDGDAIVFSEGQRLKSVSAAGGPPRDVAVPDSSMRYFYPFVLPGGSAALASIRTIGSGVETWRIGVVDLASGAVDTLAFGVRAEYAEGHLVFTGADNTLLVQPFDLRRRVTTGEAVALVSRVRLSGSSNHEFAVSATGSLVYLPASGDQGEVLRIAGLRGRTAVPLPGREGGNYEEPAVSPDGRRIALRLSNSGGSGRLEDIWLLDRQQGTLERFTVGGGNVPVWSRDGRSIAYTAVDSGPHGPAGLYVRAADQTGAPRLVLRGGNQFAGSWLPDGRTLLFQAQGLPRTFVDIGSIAVGDSAPRWLVATEFRERHPQVSPDGRWLAYTSDRTGQSEINVQPLSTEGGRIQVSTGGGTAPRWSPDGRTLFYVEGTSIVAATLAPGPSFRVTARRTVVEGGLTDLNGTNSNWDVLSNGREFLFIDQLGGETARPVWMLDWPALASSMRTGGP